MRMFKKVLVAVDGSYYSKEAVPVAIDIAEKFGASLFVLHVAEHDRGRASAYSIETPAEATKMVADAVKQARDAGLSAHGELVDKAAGHVANAITDTAAKEQVDLIVMGSRGHGRLAGLLLGSVTQKVTGLARCPVLVVKACWAPCPRCRLVALQRH